MSEFATRRQYLAFGGVLAAICLALGFGYFFFLRTDYAILASDLRPEDAAAIVAELDKRNASYRIEDGGSAIRVPAGEIDATRVAIAGSDAAARGQIGFELFNKSDMGLTNFAQKINYQRALQGELVRTITAMDGIETARVHLGLPERSLFRGERTQPSAAVTVTMKPERIPDAARVSGIQRLVAAAVPDLPSDRVVVLDGRGRVISAAAVPVPAASELDERQATQAYYAARARAAAEPILGAGQFSIRALVQTRGADEAADAGGGNLGEARAFALRIVVVTPSAIRGEELPLVRDAIAQSVGVDVARGDSIEFETGPLTTALAPPAPATPPRAAPSSGFEQQPVRESGLEPAAQLLPGWLWAMLAVGTLLGAGLALLRRRAQMTSEEHQSFAARLQRQLAITEEAGDAQLG